MDEKEFQQKLINRYLNNQCTDEEFEAFFHLIEKDQISNTLTQHMDESLKTDEELDHPHTYSGLISEKRKLNLLKFLGYAATLMLVISVSFYFYQCRISLNHATNRVKYVIVETEKGEMKKIELSDGSVVILNAHSRIRYPEAFSNKMRELDLLEGEAYFDIYHDKNKPFIVKSGNVSTQVLGTAFNVCFYKYLKAVSISVTKGKVSVTHSQHNKTTDESILLPGDKISIDKISGKVTHNKIAIVDNAMGWTNGKLIFDNKSLEEVTNILSDRFNKEIVFTDKKIMRYHITATFNNTDSISDIIKMLCISNKLKYHIIRQKIELTLN